MAISFCRILGIGAFLLSTWWLGLRTICGNICNMRDNEYRSSLRRFAIRLSFLDEKINHDALAFGM